MPSATSGHRWRRAAVEEHLPDDTAAGSSMRPGTSSRRASSTCTPTCSGDATTLASMPTASPGGRGSRPGSTPAPWAPSSCRDSGEFIVEPARSASCRFINISYLGLAGLNYDEYCNPAACDVPLLERVAGSAPDLVLGIKTRMGKEGVCYPGLSRCAGGRASEVTGLRVMCHISQAPPAIEEVLGLLRTGDIVTHAYTGGGERLIDGDGRSTPAARRRAIAASCSISAMAPARSRSERPRRSPLAASGRTPSPPTCTK